MSSSKRTGLRQISQIPTSRVDMPAVLARTPEPEPYPSAAAPQGKGSEDDDRSLASTVDDSDGPETPARLTSPPVIDIRYNPEKKSLAELAEEDDDESMGNSTKPIDIRYNPDKKSWAELDEEDEDSRSCWVAAATPEENHAPPRTAGFEYRGHWPRSKSWAPPFQDIIWEEEYEGPINLGCFPPARSWPFPGARGRPQGSRWQ